MLQPVDLVNIVVAAAVLSLWNVAAQDRDYITFMEDKLELLELNRQLVLNLYDYANELQEKTDTIRRMAEEIQRTQLQAAEGKEMEFLSNPLHSFSLIRHMHADWTHLKHFMEQPVGEVQIGFIRRHNAKLPSLEDVDQASSAMYRIMDAYALEPKDMANGLFDGVQYDAKLSLLDCFELANFFFLDQQYIIANKWLWEVHILMNQSQADLYALLGVSRIDVSLLMARSFSARGKEEVARFVLMSEPQLRPRVDDWLDSCKTNHSITVKKDRGKIVKSDEVFNRLCRASFKPKPTRLHCSYKTTPSPFLRLAPFKMEQLSMDPYVVVYHNVTYQSETAVLHRISQKQSKRAYVKNPDGKSVISPIRTANGVWLPNDNITDEEHDLVDRIRSRIEDMSELLLTGDFNYYTQLLEYGFGGHYNIHGDYLNSTNSTPYYDDRIATVLFYLNDVVSGGATAFPTLQLAVQPEQGKVLHWYNLWPETFDFDTRTVHGACPVIIGNKLVMTQWIHEWDQMFIRLCSKPPQTREYNFDIPADFY